MLILPASAKKSVRQSGNLRKTHFILSWCRLHSPEPFLTEVINESVVMHQKSRFSIKLSLSSREDRIKSRLSDFTSGCVCVLLLLLLFFFSDMCDL